MRSFVVMPAVFTVSLLLCIGCEKPAEPEPVRVPESRYNEYSTRLEAAKLMTNVGKRDEALTKLIREASINARLEAVKQGLTEVSDTALRDKVAGEAALKLASVSAGAAALTVAKTITDVKLRDEVLAKIVIGPSKE
jgi:hypothetical protein